MYILIETYEKDIMFVADTGRSEWSGLRGEPSTEVQEFTNKKQLVSYIKNQKKNKLSYTYKVIQGKEITKELNKNELKNKKVTIDFSKFA